MPPLVVHRWSHVRVARRCVPGTKRIFDAIHAAAIRGGPQPCSAVHLRSPWLATTDGVARPATTFLIPSNPLGRLFTCPDPVAPTVWRRTGFQLRMEGRGEIVRTRTGTYPYSPPYANSYGSSSTLHRALGVAAQPRRVRPNVCPGLATTQGSRVLRRHRHRQLASRQDDRYPGSHGGADGAVPQSRAAELGRTRGHRCWHALLGTCVRNDARTVGGVAALRTALSGSVVWSVEVRVAARRQASASRDRSSSSASAR